MRFAEVEEELFGRLVDDPSAPGGLDAAARAAEPGNFLRHIAALGASKLADGLIDPKLVLAWLISHLGAGAFWGGLLVPVREAGALMPQLFTAGAIGRMRRRKWVWAAGAAMQGLAALVIVAVALGLRGPVAGAAMVAALAVLARSACSVACKDVLGKTVGQSRRGTATGLAASLASGGVILFALLLLWGGLSRAALVIGAIALAGLLWMLAGAVFATLREAAQPRQDVLGPLAALGQLRLLRQDRQLRLFIAARSLLVGTALAPPYLVMLVAGAGQGLRTLGMMVMASAVASLISSWVWGRMSDRSSRRVLIWSGLAGAAALMLAVLLAAPGARLPPVPTVVVLFGLMIAYHGVRQGRSTYLVDMAPPDSRAAYTAVSNTVVGVVLLLAGAGAAALAATGVIRAVLAFAIAALLGAVLAWKLDEASE